MTGYQDDAQNAQKMLGVTAYRREELQAILLWFIVRFMA